MDQQGLFIQGDKTSENGGIFDESPRLSFQYRIKEKFLLFNVMFSDRHLDFTLTSRLWRLGGQPFGHNGFWVMASSLKGISADELYVLVNRRITRDPVMS